MRLTQLFVRTVTGLSTGIWADDLNAQILNKYIHAKGIKSILVHEKLIHNTQLSSHQLLHPFVSGLPT